MNEYHLAVLRLMSDGVERQAWQIISAVFNDGHPQCRNGICRPAVALAAVGLLSKTNGVYAITGFGRVALSWFDGGAQ